MNLHMVWTQGWDAAPVWALQNAAAWEHVGTVRRWCVETAVEEGLVPRAALDAARIYAMKADIIYAAAMLKFGGMSVGTSMFPLDIPSIKEALHQSKHCGRGFIIYQCLSNQPYNCGSYFPKDHPWLQLVLQEQLRKVLVEGNSTEVHEVTGPHLWANLMHRHAHLFMGSVCIIPSWLAFSFDSRERDAVRPRAWINPGLRGSWKRPQI